MFYTELDPYTLQKVYVPKAPKDKAKQRALLQYFNPKNKALVIEALKDAKRYDLIGTNKGCLVTPDSRTLIKSSKNKNSKLNRGGNTHHKKGYKNTKKQK